MQLALPSDVELDARAHNLIIIFGSSGYAFIWIAASGESDQHGKMPVITDSSEVGHFKGEPINLS
ncbi:uncharacterized protein J3R85_005972 [Psidium guajava]|nr:uncharacterized protein J3R85_005972 [Psidium guajava]